MRAMNPFNNNVMYKINLDVDNGRVTEEYQTYIAAQPIVYMQGNIIYYNEICNFYLPNYNSRTNDMYRYGYAFNKWVLTSKSSGSKWLTSVGGTPTAEIGRASELQSR